MTTVFISYAREDRDRVGKLAGALEALGWSVWWDPRIKAGQSFDLVIERELDTAQCVVVLWSRQSVLSEWVKNEASAAADRGVLIPALIDEIKPPLEFRRKQAADLIGWAGDPSHPGFKGLCEAISSTVGPKAAELLPAHAPEKQVGRSMRRPWLLGCWVGAAVLLGIGSYFGGRMSLPDQSDAAAAPPPSMTTSPGQARVPTKQPGEAEGAATDKGSASNLAAPGIFEFNWPGSDCWKIHRGEVEATSSCGKGKHALQAGTYMVRPSSSAVFEPFTVKVLRGQTVSAP